MAFPYVVVWGEGGAENGVKSLSLPLWSGRRETSRSVSSSTKSRLSPADCCVCFYQLGELLLLDPLLHWRAAVTDAAAAAQPLPISLPRPLALPPTPPPPPRTLTSSPASRSSCFTPLQWLASHTGGHCRIHGPVYSAFSCLCFVCFICRGKKCYKHFEKKKKNLGLNQTVCAWPISSYQHQCHLDKSPVFQ